MPVIVSVIFIITAGSVNILTFQLDIMFRKLGIWRG